VQSSEEECHAKPQRRKGAKKTEEFRQEEQDHTGSKSTFLFILLILSKLFFCLLCAFAALRDIPLLFLGTLHSEL
jgi:hypothetical protein